MTSALSDRFFKPSCSVATEALGLRWSRFWLTRMLLRGFGGFTFGALNPKP